MDSDDSPILLLQGTIRDSQCIASVGLAKPAAEGEALSFTFFPALIDTGASHSAIRPDVSDRLGLDVVQFGTIGGVESSGDARQAHAIIGLVDLAGRKVLSGFPVAIARLTRKVEVVIGMDVLSTGTFEMDGPSGLWTWTLWDEGNWTIIPTTP